MNRSLINNFLLTWFLLFGCMVQSINASETESWIDIVSPNACIGKWEGQLTIFIPKDDANFIPESSIEISIFMEFIKGADVVNSNMKFDFDKFVTDWQHVEEIAEIGFTKDSLWELLADNFLETPGFVCGNDYYVTYDLSDKTELFFLPDDNGKIQINKNGNKLKMVFNEILSFGLGDSGFSEIVLNKK